MTIFKTTMTNYTLLKWPLILAAILVSFNIAAQQPLNNVVASKETSDGRFNFLKFGVSGKGRLQNTAQQPEDIKKMFGLGSKHSFVPDEFVNNNRSFRTDQAGASHTRYKQYFNGVEIEYGVITLHSKDGALSVLTGEYFNIDENFSTTPALPVKSALDKALLFVGAKKYSWEDSSISNPVLKSIPKGQLVICKNYMEDAKVANGVPQMELAYKFAIYATEPLRYDYIYVSARTGNIIHVNPIIKHAAGTGATRYSGTKTIATTQQSANNYILKDSGGNYNIATYNLNRGSNYTTAPVFSDNDNNWTAAEYNNTNSDNAGLDAHWGAMMTQDYWRTVHNRSSFDNKGTQIKNYVHYGSLYANAFWDGYEMTYGDGDGTTMGPLTSVDICGHEIGHGICQYTANLTYSYESGAINEGFSDIWGACIKRFADASKNTWQIGDEISSSGTPGRSMSNPKSQGQPDTYKGVNWYTGYNDNGGVHYNSGVMNHWFYILTEGKTGTNDKGTSYNVKGIGITKAAQIAYRAENLYLYPNAMYADTRIAAIQAAEDLFGAGSNEVIQTTEAWNAVGVADVLARPDSVSAAMSNNNVVVKWRFNTFQSVGGFKIQRALNGTGLYATIASVNGDARSFNDTGYVNNSLNQYRIRSFRDSLYSDYSDVASVAVGNAPFIMTNGTFTKCGVTFFDPGGQGYYSSGNYVTTIKPTDAGTKLKIVFNEFNLASYDYLSVYNGPSANSPILASYGGTALPAALESSAPGGELTFVFNPYNSNSAPGWKAFISCFKPVAAPANLAAKADSSKIVHLSWTDNSNDESNYVVEKSLNDSLHFSPAISLAANTTGYDDTSAPDNSYLYYRVRAFRDTVPSRYTNTAGAVNGTVYSMQNGTINSCSLAFLDPGGVGNYNNGNYMTTVSPGINGNKLKIVFSQFNTGGDYLNIYNGPSSSSPLLGSFTGATLPPVLQSTAAGGELTFVFNPYYYSTSPGWVANISCFKPVSAPVNLTATRNNTKDVQLKWTDGANDETRYVVERSLNDSVHYFSLTVLAPNVTEYNDTSAPQNSYIYYRVRAFRDSVASLYTNTVSIVNGSAYTMQSGTVSACGITFLDPGGTGNYSSGSYTTTIRPDLPGTNLRINFSQFNVDYYDNLYIYNGPSTSSPLLGRYNAATLPPVLSSTSPGGELTFVFSTSYSNTYQGWVAYISCYKPVAKPTNLKAIQDNFQRIGLTWRDNADDETKYVIERSVNAPAQYTTLAQLPTNATQYTDSTAPANSLLFYRVRAYRDTLGSFYSDTVTVALGNAPFLIKDSTLITCDKVFLDPGGVDVIASNNYFNTRTTFKPAIAGNNIKVQFSKFRLSGSLYVYNGSSASSPLLGTFNSYSSVPTVFNGTGSDGSLTFLYQGYSSGDSGWIAQVTCYKPVAKPTVLNATVSSEQRIVLKWTDNADDDTKYVVERSINASSLFTPIVQLPSNTSQYTDTSMPANSLLYYRVRAYRDTLGSFYSDTAAINFGNAPFLMKDSTVVTCDKIFMDPGGADVFTPGSYYYTKATFKPSVAGNNIRVAFSKFRTNGYLHVYNGPSTSSPRIGSYNGYYTAPLVFTGTGNDGSLTFVYEAYSSIDSGWVAQVDCYKPVSKPTALKAITESSEQVGLTWADNADDETKYVVERSVNAPSLYKVIAQLPSNAVKYTDTSAPLNSLLYYRVKAYRDTTGSFYSDTAAANFGNATFLMTDSTLTTCDKVFMDPGGTDIILQNNNYYNIRTTFRPAVAGNNIKVTFSKFNLNYNGTLIVYNGPSVSSPLIGRFSGYYPNSLIFDGTGSDGSLTFVYQSYSYLDSGWIAKVSCYKPVVKPSNVKAIAGGSQQIGITWTDNADNETEYVVERSVNSSSLFSTLTKLAANSSSYTDATAPANSLLYYRVRAYSDTLGSFYSDTASINFGNAPFLMKDSTLITCDKVFMDPGGADIIPRNNNNYYNIRTTFKPDITGNKIKVEFSKFRINGVVYVYNGPSASSPQIDRLDYYSNSPFVYSSTAADGSLTFVYQGYAGTDSGWLAQVSCYKPVAKPSGLKATPDDKQQIGLTWSDNSDDETKYVVERSVNATTLFTPIAQIPSNTTRFTDSTPPTNSLLYYRVRAYRDTLSSVASDTALLEFGNAPYIMKEGTLITCDKVFMDPAGADEMQYGTQYDIRTTFKPGISGKNIKVVFNKISLYNYLYVYNGSSTSSPVIGGYNGGYVPDYLVFKSSAPDGSLTFSYQGVYAATGWEARVSCYTPIAVPANLKLSADSINRVHISWADNANNERGYLIERSANDSFHFKSIADLPANTTSYNDTTAAINSYSYYRIKAYIDSNSFEYSNAVPIINGAYFTMQNVPVSTCGITFLDPGGLGNYNNGNYITTIKPATPGNNLRIEFSQFNVNYDYLSIYNGPSASSPLLGTYSNSTLPPVLQSTAPGGELTFVFNSYYSERGSGWVAYVSCFKPVLKPGGLKAIADSVRGVRLSWTDNADDETKYVVERSVNGAGLYGRVADLASNTTQYIDSAAPVNSILYYRVKAYRDTLGSFYSDTAVLNYGNIPIFMKDSTVITCDKVFMDPGGADVIPSSNYFNIRTTFKSAIIGNNIKVSFSKFRSNTSLYVYNGPSTNSPLIGSYSGNFSNVLVFNGTGADGSLTFAYSGYSNSDSGWVAQVSCYKPVARPSALRAIADSAQRVALTWTDNSDDETKYIVERSVNAPSQYKIVAQLKFNATGYLDTVAPANSLIYYRVRAYRDTLSSLYSDTAAVAVGDAPILMKDTTLVTCNKVFLDPGGVDIISSNTYFNTRITFKPSIPGNNIKVVFSTLKLSGYLYVYNGSSTSSPSLGYYTGSNLNSIVLSSTAADGSLTFSYQGYSYADSGWVAQVSCYKPIARPSGLQAIADSSQMVRLSWKDNADNETGYVLERSVNAPSQYKTIAQLSSNTSQYADSTAPGNSVIYYRVRAYSDSASSLYSDTAAIAIGNAPYLMKNGIVFTCQKVFLDPGGADIIPLQTYYNLQTTFIPEIRGNNIIVNFSKLNLSGSLYIYDGLSSSSPLLATLNNYNTSSPRAFASTGADGALTFVYQGYSYSDSGWTALVSCFKLPEKPTGISAIADTSQKIRLSWTDNANDETTYVVERSINAPSQFKRIAEVPSNTTRYADASAPANSLIYYRVRAYRDTLSSLYSDTAIVAIGNAPFTMKDTTLVTCNTVFMDPGGTDIIPQGIYYNIRTTFKAGISGNNIKVLFSKFKLSGSLYVYDGPSATSPLIAGYSGNFPNSLVFHSTATDGSLTFVYTGYSNFDSGWVAQVSCYKPVAAPGNLSASAANLKAANLSWTDNANDETGYVVERSFNDPLNFTPLITLAPNTTNYTDTSAPVNSFIFYRVRAYRDSVGSPYSGKVSLINGNVFTMRGGNISACGITFLDPGGDANYPNSSNYTTTFTSPEIGKKIRVVFNSFNTESCCDYLTVYNGPDASYPLLGIYLGSDVPPVLQSSAPNGELTFMFTSDRSTTGTGWSAYVSCIKTSDTLAICSTDSNEINALQSDVTGTTYQWQKFNGTSFVNIYDDLNNSGTNTSVLNIKNGGLGVSEKFRCVTDKSLSREFYVIKANRWTGRVSNDWNDSNNWSCGTVPDANTDVLIEGGMMNNPVVKNNGVCRSIKVLTGATLQISSGYTLSIQH